METDTRKIGGKWYHQVFYSREKAAAEARARDERKAGRKAVVRRVEQAAGPRCYRIKAWGVYTEGKR